jgi:hypothetical protein
MATRINAVVGLALTPELRKFRAVWMPEHVVASARKLDYEVLLDERRPVNPVPEYTSASTVAQARQAAALATDFAKIQNQQQPNIARPTVTNSNPPAIAARTRNADVVVSEDFKYSVVRELVYFWAVWFYSLQVTANSFPGKSKDFAAAHYARLITFASTDFQSGAEAEDEHPKEDSKGTKRTMLSPEARASLIPATTFKSFITNWRNVNRNDVCETVVDGLGRSFGSIIAQVSALHPEDRMVRLMISDTAARDLLDIAKDAVHSYRISDFGNNAASARTKALLHQATRIREEERLRNAAHIGRVELPPLHRSERSLQVVPPRR